MTRSELFSGESSLSKALLSGLATVLSALGVALMLGALLLGGKQRPEQAMNPLLVQPVEALPLGAQRAITWEADHLAGDYLLEIRGTQVSGKTSGRKGRVKGVHYRMHGPVPTAAASWFIRPTSPGHWIRLVGEPSRENRYTLTIRVEGLYPGGNPCGFEVFYANP
jgi:hypothetical protein